MNETAVAQKVAQANAANVMMNAALVEFTGLCEIRSWEAVEEARQKVMGHMEAYLDGLAAAHRMMDAPW